MIFMMLILNILVNEVIGCLLESCHLLLVFFIADLGMSWCPHIGLLER